MWLLNGQFSRHETKLHQNPNVKLSRQGENLNVLKLAVAFFKAVVFDDKNDSNAYTYAAPHETRKLDIPT
jgi:hypothetical protein